MKKIVLVMFAMLSMTSVFAENEEANRVNVANVYDMNVNIRRLGETLGLTLEQMETVADIHSTFCGEMMIASQSHKDDQKRLIEKAVNKDLKYMGYVLTAKQYQKYEKLLNTTLENRGLNK